MALIPKSEYDDLRRMLSVHGYTGTTHTMGVTKGKHYLDVRRMSPSELIAAAKKALPSTYLTDSYITAPGAQRAPFGPHRLYNLAVEELIRRYQRFGREWMRVDSTQANPPEADV